MAECLASLIARANVFKRKQKMRDRRMHAPSVQLRQINQHRPPPLLPRLLGFSNERIAKARRFAGRCLNGGFGKHRGGSRPRGGHRNRKLPAMNVHIVHVFLASAATERQSVENQGSTKGGNRERQGKEVIWASGSPDIAPGGFEFFAFSGFRDPRHADPHFASPDSTSHLPPTVYNAASRFDDASEA